VNTKVPGSTGCVCVNHTHMFRAHKLAHCSILLVTHTQRTATVLCSYSHRVKHGIAAVISEFRQGLPSRAEPMGALQCVAVDRYEAYLGGSTGSGTVAVVLVYV
jgi:hypothetical protein